jgi:hypothetical protein
MFIKIEFCSGVWITRLLTWSSYEWTKTSMNWPKNGPKMQKCALSGANLNIHDGRLRTDIQWQMLLIWIYCMYMMAVIDCWWPSTPPLAIIDGCQRMFKLAPGHPAWKPENSPEWILWPEELSRDFGWSATCFGDLNWKDTEVLDFHGEVDIKLFMKSRCIPFFFYVKQPFIP